MGEYGHVRHTDTRFSGRFRLTPLAWLCLYTHAMHVPATFSFTYWYQSLGGAAAG
jgi:hypothetical protein